MRERGGCDSARGGVAFHAVPALHALYGDGTGSARERRPLLRLRPHHPEVAIAWADSVKLNCVPPESHYPADG
ncbi:hypothetical protein JCM4814A_92960 [Streptomyces phaeofaciens JCM 4814]|uniref:Uncharacterized protein n=1 Tax=Streptomyces phaeofaciens TaxID=68254 RepID=A0A918HJR3_9ACTN|nr:hypothetical protein GCM10010226_56300 [Streptomyces phaeofaciens]